MLYKITLVIHVESFAFKRLRGVCNTPYPAIPQNGVAFRQHLVAVHCFYWRFTWNAFTKEKKIKEICSLLQNTTLMPFGSSFQSLYLTSLLGSTASQRYKEELHFSNSLHWGV